MTRESEKREKRAEKLRKKNPGMTEDEIVRAAARRTRRFRRLEPLLWWLGAFGFLVLGEITGAVGLSDPAAFAYLISGTFFVTGVVMLIARILRTRVREPRSLDLKKVGLELWVRPLLRGWLYALIFLLWICAFFYFLYRRDGETGELIAWGVSVLAVPTPIFLFHLIRKLKIRRLIAAGEFTVSRCKVEDKGYEDTGTGGTVNFHYYLFFTDGRDAEVRRPVYYFVETGEEVWLLSLTKDPNGKEHRFWRGTVGHTVLRTAEWELADELRGRLIQRPPVDKEAVKEELRQVFEALKERKKRQK